MSETDRFFVAGNRRAGDQENEQVWGHQAESEPASMALEQRIGALYYEDLRMDLYRYVLTLGPAPETAQEITQESFVRLYEALHQGSVIEIARGWLLGVAHNLAINTMGSKGYTATEIHESTVATEETAEDHLIDEERRTRLWDQIDLLSIQQRGCLELRAQGLRYREIGEIMGISTSAVGEFLRRAIEKLREALNE